ncbi:YjbH domain-containing protein [Yoonia sp. SS1-5]|uniref:YjbH domain-containing protein n=1 Tax=Yoonia rhodophyticola TaxID=3137370 RepID=A0AAN0NJ77_9RHOB
MPKRIHLAPTVAVAASMVAGSAGGQDVSATYSLYGTPGLLETPTAQSAPENEVAATFAYTDTYLRSTLTFQITKRLSGSFRYSNVDLYDDPFVGSVDRDLERGFDLQYRFNNEGQYLPAMAIGLRDFLTPGRFQSEYLVASKSVGDALIVSAGLGWGQLATADGFDSPFGSRSVAEPSGQLGPDAWFRGDAALFGGFEYQINDRWGVKAEYSTIAYPEVGNGVAIPVESPYNYGLTYRPREGVQLGLSYLYGTQVGISGSFALNPNRRPGSSGTERAPAPIKVRSADARAAQSWDRAAVPENAIATALSALLKTEGITLSGVDISDTTARIRYTNGRYRSEAQAAGRVARMATQVVPDSVKTFVLEPQRRGIPLSAIRIARSDLEQLENRAGGTDAILSRAEFDDAGPTADLRMVDREGSSFAWGLGPYFRLNPFSGNGSVDLDIGLSLRGVYTIRPNMVLSGAIEQSLLEPEDDPAGVDATPDVQNVRSDGSRYGNDGVPVLSSLTFSHFARPGTDLYSRVSVGYLERFFGGVSGELLWKPVNSSLGLGVEINQVAQRDSDMRFGFEEYDYDVTTGHVSAYYDFGNGYHAQVDAGRYLAGDWGATISVDREFDNGWVIGAYVTQTDLAYEDFGSGSYNKGVQVTVPQDFFTGSPTRGSYANTFRTRAGDGGARLQVDGRLYDVVRDGHLADLSDTWGRFWR